MKSQRTKDKLFTIIRKLVLCCMIHVSHDYGEVHDCKSMYMHEFVPSCLSKSTGAIATAPVELSSKNYVKFMFALKVGEEVIFCPFILI